jgi:ATP-dependent DNA helicase RecG
MKTAEQLIEELNALDECVSIEAKTGSSFGNSALETVCAFANEPGLGGGYLILGIEPADDTFWPIYKVTGVADPDLLQQNIASQCATSFNVAIRPQISVEQIHSKMVVIVFVPESGAHEKPIHFRNQPLPRAALRRIGSTDQRCTEDDMIVFYHDRIGGTYDDQAIRDSSLDDLDPDAIELYRILRRDVNAEAEELRWSDVDLLRALGATKSVDGKETPTVAGVLLFGKSMALRRLFPMMRIDYVRVPGLRWVKDPDRRFDTIEIRAPLIRAIQRVRAAILDDLPKAFSLPAGEVQSKEVPLLPDRVVREVVANAVMHRDYKVHGSIQVIRYSNRLEVRNPGYSLKSEERLGQPGSETRNPKIAAVLHDVKFAETKGSGIRVMRELMTENSLSLPLLESDRANNSFMAMLLFHHFLSPEDLAWLKSFDSHHLNEEEMKAMISAREVGAINNSTYRDINRNVDTLSASKQLKKLCDCGLLEKKGRGSATYYVTTPEALKNWGIDSFSLESSELSVKTGELDIISGELSVKSGELDVKSGELDVKSGELSVKSGELSVKPGGSVAELQEPIPEDISKILDSLGGKSKSDILLDAIVKLLKWKELSLVEIAKYVCRTPEHVRTAYIFELLNADLIELTIPEKPTDPNQRYRYKKSRRDV